MSNLFNKEELKSAVRETLQEIMISKGETSSSPEIAENRAQKKDPTTNNSSIRIIRGPEVKCTRFPFDIGPAGKGVFTKDILTLEESPRLGAGFMEIYAVTFPWVLKYDEVEYIVEGVLNISTKDQKITATAGDVVFIPKDTEIEFSSPSRARFLYVTYPANWQDQ